jgi:MYXO-CTERM domain-containing protein
MSSMKPFARYLVVMPCVALLSPARAMAAADAGAKTLINYFLPTPIVCPLTSNTWGAAGVLPRDTCNGLEDSTNKQWQYWDGKVLNGPDGKYHMYAGQWPQNKGFSDWPNSVIAEAVSNGTVIGSYVLSTTTPFTGKEQNVTGAVLSDGSYVLLDSLGKSGTGNVYTSTSLADPWTSRGQFQMTANGSTISTQTTENLTIWANADGSFEIMSRSFQEMVSASNILGPYTIKATVPSLQSQGYEDPVIWCSGGQYHLVANGYNARKANHYTSTDGINNWKNMGLAYDPTSDFVRYTDGTVNHWYKMERAGVVMENGHVTAFTFAVIDVDKTLDVANDTHGTKIIVVPFDGVSFDRDNPGPGSAACPADSGSPVDAGPVGGSGGHDGGSGAGGATGTGGAPGTGGKTGTGGTTTSGGTTGVGGATGTGGKTASGGNTALGGTPATGGTAAGGATAIGGAPATGGATAGGGASATSSSAAAGGGTATNGTGGGAGGTVEAGGSPATAGTVATGGAVGIGGSAGNGGTPSTGPVETGGSTSTGGAPGPGTTSGTTTVAQTTQASSGCSCRVGGDQATSYPGFALLALLVFALRLRKRR